MNCYFVQSIHKRHTRGSSSPWSTHKPIYESFPQMQENPRRFFHGRNNQTGGVNLIWRKPYQPQSNVREPAFRCLRLLFLVHLFTLMFREVWSVAVSHLGAQHQRIHSGAQETGDRFRRGAHHRLILVQGGIEQDRYADAREEPGNQRMITRISAGVDRTKTQVDIALPPSPAC
jgi:hypothetical protein